LFFILIFQFLIKNSKKKFQETFISNKNKIILDKDGKEKEKEESKEEEAINECLSINFN
jgi:hypothetical protein